MKPFIVACLLVAAVQADPGAVIKAKWSSFKAQHGKVYEPHEEELRLTNFLKTTTEIEEHNTRFHAGEVSYQLGHNKYSDLSDAEFKKKMQGRTSIRFEGRNFTRVPPSNMPSLPASVDWRKHGIVSPPKDQAGCGSCYAFGALGVIESAIAVSTGRILDLSEQQIVDCSYRVAGRNNNGCDGGHEVTVMDWVQQSGVVTEDSYRYTSGQSESHNSCKRRSGSFGKTLRYLEVPANDERALAEAVSKYGTLTMAISAEGRDWKIYSGGIYDNPSCSKEVGHAVSVVGYGSENGKDFWILKNSWGTTWGENGFMRIRRGVNMCGLVSDPAYAIQV